MKSGWSRLAAYSVALLVPSVSFAGVIRVRQGASGAGDGSSWADAYPDLRPALDAALPGDELWVAQATYVPGPTAASSDTFLMKSGVALYGGFAGVETSRAQRDWAAHPTVLSGDVGQDDVYTPTWNIGTSNSAHVVTALGVDATAVLDGFVVRAGHTGPVGTPAGAPEMFGGGLYAIGASPTVANCVFERNVCAFASGGAIYLQNASPAIQGCRFEANWAHLGSGAGIFASGASQPRIEDCVFTGNVATSGSGGAEAQGAAIGLWMTPPVAVRRSVFEQNQARQFSPGSGIELPRGGAISCFLATIEIERCAFRGNSAASGGAVSVWGPTRVVDSLFVANQAYAVPIQGQSTGGHGGALVDNTNASSAVEVLGCTIAANTAGEAAVWCSQSADETRIANSILWGNVATGAGQSLREMQYKGSAALAWSCVQGLFQPVPGEPPPDPAHFPGCLESDPLFAASPADLRLSAASPCVDAGSNLHAAGLLVDLDGNQRVVAATAPAPRVDLGAYEHASSPPPACRFVHTPPAAATVAAGGAATLFVGAGGVGPIAYRWRKDGIDLQDGGAVTGAASAVLVISPAGRGDAGSYDVRLTDACGSIVSPAATLTVVAATPVALYCFGDGSGTPCPCGNASTPGDDVGCVNSTGEGGKLEGGGLASVAADTFHLDASDVPSTNGIYLQGTLRANGGAGTVLGDGLLCVAGTLVRLAVVPSTGGSSTYPDTGDLAVSVRGNVQPGATHTYQLWYRDPAGWCTSATYDLTNALEVVWLP